VLVPVQYVHIGIGLLLAVFSVPLIQGRIPRNCWYGIRTRKAFSSEENWYAVNGYGGKLFLAFGVFLFAFGVITSGVAPPPESEWAPVYMTVPLVALIPVFLAVSAFEKRLPE
jgi:hypothetical protein